MKRLQHIKLLSNAPAVVLPSIAILIFVAIARYPSHLNPYKSFASPPGHDYLSNSALVRVPTGCDIFRGEWVPDADEPRYTNSSCVVIQEHQNCIKYGRPDLGFLKWRWKPRGCELPRLDALRFLELVRDTSLAFVGDSLARNHMQSLMCLLTKVEYPKDVSKTADTNFRNLHYEGYNFTISIFWSPFLVRAKEAAPDGGTLWSLYLDEPDEAWAAGIAAFDYVMISAANWFTRPSMFYEAGRLVGCHYCLVPNVTDLTLRYSLRMAFRTALRAVGSLDAGFRGKVIVRTLSPTSHFEGGEWNKGGDCRRTRPRRSNETSMAGLDLDLHTAQVEEFWEAEAAARGKAMRMMLMDATEAMLLRPDGHPSRYGHWAHENVTLYNDCVHWCLPGPIDVWNDMLFQMLLD